MNDNRINVMTSWEYTTPDPEVAVIQVVKTTLLRRGNGTPEDPIRCITQLWSMQGELLAERDPLSASVTENVSAVTPTP
jgi:hypothetical protein